MIERPSVKDRRRNKRFQAQAGAFVVFRPEYTKLGQIIDMSMGGLSFRYMANQEAEAPSTELDIFVADNDFHLPMLPVEVVSDLEADQDIPFSSITMRRGSVKFKGLNHNQASQLREFLEKHTTDQS